MKAEGRGFRVWGLVFRVQGLRFRVRVLRLGFSFQRFRASSPSVFGKGIKGLGSEFVTARWKPS